MTEGADSVGTLHFAHFVPLADTHLGFFTIFDGTFEKYIGRLYREDRAGLRPDVQVCR